MKANSSVWGLEWHQDCLERGSEALGLSTWYLWLYIPGVGLSAWVFPMLITANASWSTDTDCLKQVQSLQFWWFLSLICAPPWIAGLVQRSLWSRKMFNDVRYLVLPESRMCFAAPEGICSVSLFLFLPGIICNTHHKHTRPKSFDISWFNTIFSWN